ncbi:MAG: hypothetical protein NT013_29515 [Planctomycetia bacterium]|nr:hypothetical protein [Planctomycetia bacterium]
MLSLTNEERRTLPKLGDNRLALDEDAHAFMLAHPDFVPACVSLDELEKDRALHSQLDGIRLSLESLLNDIEGTEMELGCEMLMVYLAFYASVQQGAKRGIAGGQVVLDVLRKYFARSKASATPAPAAAKSKRDSRRMSVTASAIFSTTKALEKL